MMMINREDLIRLYDYSVYDFSCFGPKQEKERLRVSSSSRIWTPGLRRRRAALRRGGGRRRAGSARRVRQKKNAEPFEIFHFRISRRSIRLEVVPFRVHSKISEI